MANPYGRPKKDPNELTNLLVCVGLPEDLWLKVRSTAKDKGMSQSALLRDVVRAWANNNEENENG